MTAQHPPPIRVSQIPDPTPGERIAFHRRTRRWTQAELAERVGVHRVSIARYETDAKRPSLPTALALAEVLGVRVEQLFDGQRSEQGR